MNARRLLTPSGALAVMLFSQAALHAQESVSRPSKSGFFKDDVDFFGERARRKAAAERDEAKQSNESIWAEPVRQPDGSFSVHVPPKQVLEFLNDPSEASAKKYLEWKRERLAKLRVAMEALRKAAPDTADVARVETQPRRAPEPEPSDAAGADLPANVLYFKKPGCPYCDYQDVVIADLAKRHPSWRMTTVASDQGDLWKRHAVTATPTLVVLTADGSAAKILRGLTFVEGIETAVRATQQRIETKEGSHADHSKSGK